jgi:hypothetical protein
MMSKMLLKIYEGVYKLGSIGSSNWSSNGVRLLFYSRVKTFGEVAVMIVIKHTSSPNLP